MTDALARLEKKVSTNENDETRKKEAKTRGICVRNWSRETKRRLNISRKVSFLQCCDLSSTRRALNKACAQKSVRKKGVRSKRRALKKTCAQKGVRLKGVRLKGVH